MLIFKLFAIAVLLLINSNYEQNLVNSLQLRPAVETHLPSSSKLHSSIADSISTNKRHSPSSYSSQSSFRERDISSANEPLTANQDGFLARFHKHLSAAANHLPKQPIIKPQALSERQLNAVEEDALPIGFNSGFSINSLPAINPTAMELMKHYRNQQREQQQLDQIQNLFGSDVADLISSLEQTAQQQPVVEHGRSRLTDFNLPVSTSSHSVVFAPEQIRSAPSEIDPLRNYHYGRLPPVSIPSQLDTDSQSEFALRPSPDAAVDNLNRLYRQLLTENRASDLPQTDEFAPTSFDADPNQMPLDQLIQMNQKSQQQQGVEANVEDPEQVADLMRQLEAKAQLMDKNELYEQAINDLNTVNPQDIPLERLLMKKKPSLDSALMTKKNAGEFAQHQARQRQAQLQQQQPPQVQKTIDKIVLPDGSKETVITSKIIEKSNPTTGDNKQKSATNTQNFSTQLKKVQIAMSDGRQLRQEESYQKSVQVSPADKNTSHKSNSEQGGEQVLLLPSNAHLEKTLTNTAQQPIAVQLRNVPVESANNRITLNSRLSSFSDVYFLGIVVACSTISIFFVIGAGICVYRFQQHHKATGDVDYPAYGVIGPVSKPPVTPGAKQPLQPDLKGGKADFKRSANSLAESGASGADSTASQLGSGEEAPAGDRKLAQSAQMYHYQHQKQQMIASEKGNNCRTSTSDVDSDEENDEGDYTVYECPGLASTGEIEVTNPLFQHSP